MRIIPMLPLLLLMAGSSLCAGQDRPPAAKDSAREASRHRGGFSEKSIYRLDSTWTTDTGASFRLDSLRGRPVVMILFFTNCEHSCPFIVKDLKALQSALSSKAKAKVEFALVSIDPERDSADALQAFRKKYNLSGGHWTLLRGDSDSVRSLADKLGFYYTPGSKTQFAHSLMVTVLDGAGEIAHQQVGIGVDRQGAIATLEKLAGGKSRQ